MKRRSGITRRVNTTIELTSLLDVIFILLFIVTQNGQIKVNNMQDASEQLAVTESELQGAESQISTLQDELARTTAEKETQEDLLDTAENIDDYVAAVSVAITYANNGAERFITIRTGDAEEKTFQMSSSSSTSINEAWNDAGETLERYIEAQNNTKPVLISANTENSLYRDNEKWNSLVASLQAKYNNLYLKDHGDS